MAGRIAALALIAAGCAAAPAVGRGGDVFEVVVLTVNGRQTAARGPSAHPACLIQVGDTVNRVWLAGDPPRSAGSPVIMKADAEGLKAGILLETGWNTAVVHHVTEDELAVGAAVVYVPGHGEPVEVELRFNRMDDLSVTAAAPAHH